jgi:hypothetical protein
MDENIEIDIVDYRRYFAYIVSISDRFWNCNIDPALLHITNHVTETSKYHSTKELLGFTVELSK